MMQIAHLIDRSDRTKRVETGYPISSQDISSTRIEVVVPENHDNYLIQRDSLAEALVRECQQSLPQARNSGVFS